MKNQNKKKITILIIVIIFIYLVNYIGLSLFSTVKNEIIETKISPDGKYKAVFFKSNLGATTDLQYELSIRPIFGNILPNVYGNTYISYDYINFFWTGVNELSIIRTGAVGPISLERRKVGPVRIIYKYGIVEGDYK